MAVSASVIDRPSTHAHHWKIDEPQGPVSRGVCARCGEVRVFRNALPEDDFLTNEEHRAMGPAAA